MRISSSTASAFGVAAAVAVLAGCSTGGSQSALAPTTLTQQSSMNLPAPKESLRGLQDFNATLFPGRRFDFTRRDTHGGAYMKPMASSGALAYVADPGIGLVYVYAWNVPGFTQGTLMGQLGGTSQAYFVEPGGMCTDKSHNIYVVDIAGPTFGLPGIWEFAPNSFVPINNYADPGNVPFSCSVDLKTGNLAVSNFETTTGGSGSVYVYPGGSPTYTPYYNLGKIPLRTVWFVGYDGMSDLFANGQYTVPGKAKKLEVLELKSGASYFTTLKFKGVKLTKLRFPGQIQWDGKGYMDFGDGQTAKGNSPADCIDEPKHGCAALYKSNVKTGIIRERGVTNFIDTPYAYGTWTVTKGGTPLVIVPNDNTVGCATPIPPAVACTQVYYYGLGVSPVQEWDLPSYQVAPAFATLSE